MDRAAWWSASLTDRLEPIRGLLVGGRGRAAARPILREQAPLVLFECSAGHERNLYTPSGIPRMHAGWEMQLLADDGLLFLLYARCHAAIVSTSAEQLRVAIAALGEELDARDPAALVERARAFYAAHIDAFVGAAGARAIDHEGPLARSFERVVIQAYLRLAMTAPRSIIALDLFPAHTSPGDLDEGLRGLVAGLTRVRHAGTQRFYCYRAESYIRYYGLNMARALDGDALRFSLVVPYANGLGHLALTRCWPIDGAENTARYIDAIDHAWAEYERAFAGQGAAPPRILVTGYSQGGAAVRLMDDAARGVDVRARPYFRRAAPRVYLQRCRALARLIEGGWPRSALPLHTVSLATMGGLDGVGLAERFPEARGLGADQRGSSGVWARANARGGLHLAICHDLDPVRWVLPGPLTNVHRRVLRGEQKLSIGRIMLKFGGPTRALHSGTWTGGTQSAFEGNPQARALLEDTARRILSERFVDEHLYVDERNGRAAFPHVVVGTYGYPGWTVVAKFAEAHAALEAQRGGGRDVPALLLRERSWSYDILPADHDYEALLVAAASFHEPQRRRAEALLRRLARAPTGDVAALAEALRERYVGEPRRAHLLGHMTTADA
ncbi:MAG: hypothetical protein KC636_29750 [Myxococcales bacterium]|nr:hypothetical protein [Myxococcales bacterium]